MSQDTRSAKRPRSEGNAGPPEAAIIRDEHLWLDDGNIVLVSGTGVAFRVYRGLLAAQSTVFANMFTSSSPNAEESHGGCPVIRLTDSPYDLKHFLHALVPVLRRHYYWNGEDGPPHVDELAAVVRLAHKYDVEDVQRQALSAFKAYYVQDYSRYTSEDWPPFDSDDWDRDSVPIAAINLARLTDTPTILPLAFFYCALIGSAVLDGHRSEGGDVEYLGRGDLKRCMDGRVALARASWSLIIDVFKDSPCAPCLGNVTAKGCRKALRTLHRNVEKHEDALSVDVFDSWTKLIQDAASEGLCDLCTQDLLDREEEARKKLWNRLPEFFKLVVEGWGHGPFNDDKDAAVDA